MPSVRLQTQLILGLRQLAGTWRPVRSEWVYDGPAGFVLEHGAGSERPRSALIPAGIDALPPRHCYANAIVLAATHGFSYVEGYAFNDFAAVPVQHAWNLAADGRLVDATWGALIHVKRVAYRGVVFSVERADDCAWNGDACVIDDWQRGWPLLRQRWAGENFALPWPPSERLDMLRNGDRQRLMQVADQLDAEAAAALSGRRRRGDPDAIRAYDEAHP